ncbi:MarR family winged helix-turn-helix transcriptional regulator [Micropruina sp.]|uniref:MarR family winged helix-turn-helix transcriptional regulator n=1 Tax=Micropruina sp. TaxID=2737536 RepID=UPI0039E45EE0
MAGPQPIDVCAADDAGRAPLPRLLAEAEAVFAIEFDRRMRTSEFPSLSLAHARNVLRQLGDEPRRASDIATDCGVSKQALSQQIAHLEQTGLVRIVPDPTDARARLVTLTEAGIRAQHLVRTLFVEIERDWAGEFGEDDLAALRRVLQALSGRRRVKPC